MDIRINDRNNYATAFQAKMQLRGDISLLDNKQVQKMANIVKDMGQVTDIVDIALPEKVIRQKGSINIAGFVNGSLEQIRENFENNNIFEGIMSGLNKLKKLVPNNAPNVPYNLNSNKQLDSNELVNIIKSNKEVRKELEKISNFDMEKFATAMEKCFSEQKLGNNACCELLLQLINCTGFKYLVRKLGSGENPEYLAKYVAPFLYGDTRRVRYYNPSTNSLW